MPINIYSVHCKKSNWYIRDRYKLTPWNRLSDTSLLVRCMSLKVVPKAVESVYTACNTYISKDRIHLSIQKLTNSLVKLTSANLVPKLQKSQASQ